jgi:hypothetical protein
MANDLEMLAEAVAEDHPCSDGTCDIAASLDAGFPEVAAWLLESATHEHAALNLWAHAGGRLPKYMEQCEGWSDWLAFHREHGRKCPSCEAFTYKDSAVICGNCGGTL